MDSVVIWHSWKSVKFNGLVTTQYGVSNSLLARKFPFLLIGKVELSLCMPWRHMEERKYSYTHFYAWHWSAFALAPPGERSHTTYYVGVCVGPRADLDALEKRKNLLPHQELDHSSSITQPATKTERQTDSAHNIWWNYLQYFRITDNLNFPSPLTETHLYMHLQRTEEVWTQWFGCLGRLFFGLRSL